MQKTMSLPGHNIISVWVSERAQNLEFLTLSEVEFSVLNDQLGHKHSPETIAELSETHLSRVAVELEGISSEYLADGITPQFILEEDGGVVYFKALETPEHALLNKLKMLSPAEFEKYCAIILEKLGGTSYHTGQKDDDCVDFMCQGIRLGSDDGPAPLSACTVVFGQAKRYTTGVTVSLTQMREFIGGALRRCHEWKAINGDKVGPLTPVVYAFWTTSDFQKAAREYSRSMGIFSLNGVGLAQLAMRCGLT